jgi:HNH endonuclease/AP2 domain
MGPGPLAGFQNTSENSQGLHDFRFRSPVAGVFRARHPFSQAAISQAFPCRVFLPRHWITARQLFVMAKLPRQAQFKERLNYECIFRELLTYDTETGIFKLKVNRGGKRAGSVAGSKNSKGYISIKVDGRSYRAHHLVRLYVRGVWPEPGYEVDHINGDKTDNRLANLRHSTRSQNQANMPARADNKCGLKGVCVHKQSGKWEAQIQASGKKLHLGMFESPELAHETYVAAAQKHFGRYARAA